MFDFFFFFFYTDILLNLFYLQEEVFADINKRSKFKRGPGRKNKFWDNLGERSKRAKIADLAENNHEALALVSSKSAVTDSSIDRTNFIFIIKKALNPDKAKYQIVRNSSLIQNASIYPSLHKILTEKKKCYPDNMIFSETSAVCPLQSIFNTHCVES